MHDRIAPADAAARFGWYRPPAARAAAAAVVLLGCAGQTAAQVDPEALRTQLRAELQQGTFAHYIAGVVNLTERPDVASARYRVDGDERTDVSTFKLPIEFDVLDLGHDRALFVEGAAGYLRTETRVADIVGGGAPALATQVDARVEAVSALAGVGLRLPLLPGLSVEPIAGVGGAYIDSRARYAGPGAPTIAPVLDGIAFNWNATTVNATASLRLSYELDLGRDHALQLASRYSYTRTWTVESTDVAQNADVGTHLLAQRAELSGPTGLELMDESLRWRTTVGHYWLPDDGGTALGFRDYFELGAGLEADVTAFGLPIDKLRVGGAYFIGERLEGWSVGIGVSLAW
ncbi:MAG: hypothetical protein AAF628_06700 [Planctomycetota bacterium]